jgi:predicted ABC-type ATPase
MRKTIRSAKEWKKIILIAGPNGAGKTTFANEFLTHEAACPDFINADLIAHGIAPYAPEAAALAAGKIMLGQIEAKVRSGKSFAFENTLSGLNYARHIPRWRKMGYHVKLIFLSLPSVELALARVRARVAQGGHDVSDAVIRRRFNAGLRNFHRLYRKIVNSWALYDNSGSSPRLISTGDNP